MKKLFIAAVSIIALSMSTIAQTKAADSDKSGLSPEGQAELKKILDEYPKFDEEKASKELLDKNKKDFDLKFSKEKLNEFQKQADKLYVPFKLGETITVQTRRKSYTGAFGGIVGEKIKVGFDFVPTIDLSQDILDKANTDLMMRKQQDYLKENYSTPKKEFEMLANASRKKYVKEQKDLYDGKQKADLIAEKKFIDKYPVLKVEVIEGFLNIADDVLKKTVVDKIKEEYSKSQPLASSQKETVEKIIIRIANDNKTVVLLDNKLQSKEAVEEEKEKKLREDKKKESEDLTKLNDEKISINIKKETNESDSEPKVSNE
jgi:hypothetical protein